MKVQKKLNFFLVFILFPFCFMPASGYERPADFPIPEPFGKLKKCLHESPWGYDNQEKAEIFNLERERLGTSFKKELFNFIAGDIDAHYWAGIFLTNDYYLQNSVPDNVLGLGIFKQGIELCEKDINREIEIVSFAVLSAVLSETMGLHEDALEFKGRVTELLESNPEYSAAFPAMAEQDRSVYDSI